MSRELKEALDILEKEKSISKDTLLEAIEQSLIQACKNHFGKADNVHVTINRETGDFSVYADRRVVEFVEDPAEEVSLVEAQKQNTNAEVGDILKVPVHSDKFGRIATQNAKNVILQKIREEERKVLFDQYHGNEKEVVTGIAGVVANGSVSGAVDLAAMTAQINAMSLGDQIGMLLELVIVKFGVWVLLGLVQIICIARFIEIYVYIAISPIPIATFPSDDLNQIAKGFLKSFAAVCLQGAFIYLILSFFPILVSSNILGDTSAWGLLLYSLILALGVFSSSRWAKSVCNAM